MSHLKKISDMVPVLVDTFCQACKRKLCAGRDKALVAKDKTGQMFVYCVPCGEKLTK